MATLWTISPLYRDVPAYLQLLVGLDAAIPEGFDRVVHAVVDDSAGADPALSSLRDLDVRVVEPPFNLGHQRALVYGLRRLLPDIGADDVIVTLDADGEDRPQDLPLLLAALDGVPEDERAVALAIRSKRRESLSFRAFYVLFRSVFRLFTGEVVRSGNFAAYRGALAHRMLTHPNFDLCYSSTLVSLDILRVGVPCERGRRLAGHSRMDFQRLALHGVRMLMPFADRIATRALIAFSAAFAAAAGAGLAVLAVRFFSHDAIPGWATYSLLAILSICVIALGNFVVLITIFSQSRALSLQDLEGVGDRRA